MAALTDAGRPFCQATYLMEGQGPLVLVAHDYLKDLDDQVEDGIKLPKAREASKRAAEIMKEEELPFSDAVQSCMSDYKNALEDVSKAVGACESAKAPLEHEHQDARNRAGSRSSGRSRPNLNYRQLNREGLVDQSDLTESRSAALADAKAALCVAEAKKVKSDEALKKATAALVEWKTQAGPLTEDEFMKHAYACVQPGYDYYTRVFNEKNGDLWRIKKGLEGCTLFDPYVLADTSIRGLELLADKLTLMNYPKYFWRTFIRCLKLEIPKAKRVAAEIRQFDWGSLPGAAEYDKKLENKLKRKAENAAKSAEEDAEDSGAIPPSETREVEIEDWFDDPSERARRMWEWWRIKVNGTGEFKCFGKALRLVVLTQVSSCAIERVFSILQKIVDCCGERMLEDMLELRCLLRHEKAKEEENQLSTVVS